MELNKFQEQIEAEAGQRAYEAAVFGFVTRKGINLTEENKKELKPLLRQASEQGIAPDRVAEIIVSTL